MKSRTVISSVVRNSWIHRRSFFWFSLPIIISSLLSSCFLISTAQSEIVEIQLPELSGIYTEGTLSREITFDLGQPVAQVHQVWIRWSGTVLFGVVQGDGDLYPPDHLFPWPCVVYANMDVPDGALLVAYIDPGQGRFQDTTFFEGNLEPDSGFLSNGCGTVTAGIAPANVPGTIMISPSIVEFDSVSVIVDLDFVTSVQNTATWGEIKSRYR